MLRGFAALAAGAGAIAAQELIFTGEFHDPVTLPTVLHSRGPRLRFQPSQLPPTILCQHSGSETRRNGTREGRGSYAILLDRARRIFKANLYPRTKRYTTALGGIWRDIDIPHLRCQYRRPSRINSYWQKLTKAEAQTQSKLSL